jgi:hypothetical protein
MAKISFREAPHQMQIGVVGIGEDHSTHWGRMLVLKLLKCDGARFLLIENAPDQQGTVDQITTGAGAINTHLAQMLDAVSWREPGVLTVSTVVYQAQKRGVRVLCADHQCVTSGNYATSVGGMRKRNEYAVNKLLSVAPTPAELRGVIMLNGADHFGGAKAEIPISTRVQGYAGLSFGWVDATTREGSGFGVRLMP